MRLWRCLQPGLAFAAAADVFTGYALVALHYGYVRPDAWLNLAALLAAGWLLAGGGHLFAAAFSPDLARRLLPEAWRPPTEASNTPVFLGAAALTLMGLVTAMSQGLPAAAAGLVLAALHLLHGAAAHRTGPSRALLYGLRRGGTVVLGMAAYPLLVHSRPGATLLVLPATVALVAMAVRSAGHPADETPRPGLAVAAALAAMAAALAVPVYLPAGPLVLGALGAAAAVLGFFLLVAWARRDLTGMACFERGGEAALVLLQAACVLGLAARRGGDSLAEAAPVLGALGVVFLVALSLAWHGREAPLA